VEPAKNKNTDTLLASAAGQTSAAEALMPLIYDELRSLAARYLGHEKPGHTLQPTALVNEAYLRMVDISRIDWQGKTHFFAVAARQMRRILVDHARAKAAAKRGGNAIQVTLDEDLVAEPARLDDLIALDQTLDRLSALDDRVAQVVELRLFGGLTAKETAHELDVSERTIYDDWGFGRAWILREMGSGA
jgi:RNA polymerase sigma-70 factor (ECF subfamily)